MKSAARLLLLAIGVLFVQNSIGLQRTHGQEAPSSTNTDLPVNEDLGEVVEKPQAAKRQDLLTMQFPGQHWSFFSGKKDSVLGDTWTTKTDSETKQTTLICSGEPYGYVYTNKEFGNYRFGLEWKFPEDANGNSGVLIHTTGDNRIWPKSLQIQLHQPVAGSTFPSAGAKANNELRNVPMLSKPVDQWNSCIITSREGVVTVTVNDELVGEVTGVDPLKGKVALQSEGAEVHFRNIWIEELAASPMVTIEAPKAVNKTADPKPNQPTNTENNNPDTPQEVTNE